MAIARAEVGQLPKAEDRGRSGEGCCHCLGWDPMIVSKLMDDLLAAEVGVARSVGGKLLVPWKGERSDFRRMAFPPIRACDVGLSWVNVGPTRQTWPRMGLLGGSLWGRETAHFPGGGALSGPASRPFEAQEAMWYMHREHATLWLLPQPEPEGKYLTVTQDIF